MINVRSQELEAIAEILNKELRLHESWRDQLHRTLVCRLSPSANDLADDAHHKCEFGKWFYSPQNAALRSLALFKNIEKLHEAMHDEARSLCNIVKNNWVITPNEYDPFLRTQQQFRNELHSIRSRVFETLRKVDALTGVFCKSELAPDLEAISRQQQENGKPCSLLRLQFDLQAINNEHGWETGDLVLRTCLGRIKAALSDQDRIYRYTGADFIVCLPGKTPNHVEQIKDILFKTIKEAVEHALLIGNAVAEKPIEAAEAEEASGKNPPAGEPKEHAPEAKTRLTVNYAIQSLKPGNDIEDLAKAAKLTTYEIEL